MLNQMKELKTTKYFFILVIISSSDILAGIIGILFYSCKIRILLLQLTTKATYWIFTVIVRLLGFTAVLQYVVLLMSSLERYIAVCQPYKYSTHPLINHLKVVFGLTAGFLAVCIGLSSIQIQQLRENRLNVVFVERGKFIWINYVVTFISSIIINVLLVKVWKELKGLTPNDSADRRLIRSASKYVIWTYVMHQSTNIPNLVHFVSKLCGISLTISNVLEAVTSIARSSYGIADVFLFIHFNPGYIVKVKKYFKVRTCTNSVASDNRS